MTTQQANVSPDTNLGVATGVAPIVVPIVNQIVEVPLELARRTFHYVVPNNNATATHLNVGFDCNMQATATFPAPAAGNFLTSQNRIKTTRTSANGLVGLQGIQAPLLRGASNQQGGFYLRWRLGFPTFDANAVFFVGVCVTARAGGQEASGVNNVCCFGADTADTDLSLITRDNAGGISKTNGGYLTKANLLTGDPSDGGPRVFDFTMQALPSHDRITMSVWDASNNAPILAATDKLANLPIATSFMRASALPSSVAVAVNTQVDFIHFFGYW